MFEGYIDTLGIGGTTPPHSEDISVNFPAELPMDILGSGATQGRQNPFPLAPECHCQLVALVL